jgi:hemolysin III
MRPPDKRLTPSPRASATRVRHDPTTTLATSLVDLLSESLVVKPRLRGWLHFGLVPLALVGGVVLVALSPSSTTRAGSAVYVASALLLFGVSATYHCGTWPPATRRVLRRLDHCNIFVLIAGSCTAYALLMLDQGDRAVMLAIVWGSAAVGVLARFLWPEAPRWLSPPIYVLAGGGAVLFLPGFIDGASRLGSDGTATLILMVTGGVLYIVGAIVYGLRRPDPWPRWFGFHEVFHTFTVLAFTSHYVGISLATYSMR